MFHTDFILSKPEYNNFSADENLDDLKKKYVTMNDEIQISDTCKLKNLATGRLIDPNKFLSTKCSGNYHQFIIAFSFE